MGPINTTSMTDTVLKIRAGELSPVAVVEACLTRIEQHEPAVLAWVSVDRAGARAAARELEAEARVGRIRGPLHGVPVGLKDIIHAAGMVTTAGAGPFAHERPETDAAAVARLRQAGAVILGKTATTEFAYADPTVTRNPWNLEHTPGGSSSGSGAAVAARMVPLALGSQTGGSTLRPAAYCGVVGLKPSHGRISAKGMIPVAWSLDHVGIITRSVEDAALALSVLAGHDPADPYSAPVAVADYVGAVREAQRPPRLGIPRGLFRDTASVEMNTHLDEVVDRFKRAGAAVDKVQMPPSSEGIRDIHNLIMRVEGAAFHAERFSHHAASYRPKIREFIEAGMATLGPDYVRAQRARQQFKDDMGALLREFDALLMPVTPTTAPRGLASTGDAVFCNPWSFAGVPAIALPSGLAEDGLPLAIQLVTGAFAEDHLLSVARWCETILNFSAGPPEEEPSNMP